MTGAAGVATIPVDWPLPEGFWSWRFTSATAKATTPFLFEGIVPTEVAGPDHVLEGLRRLRRAFRDGQASDARCRVYVGEECRNDLVDTVMSAPWDDGVDLVPWMQRLCGADKFSLVINNLETTSPGLAAGLGGFVDSSFSGWGVPIGGCEQVAFAGNYAGTAFGVHEGHEDAFLVHLGPGVKHFYCWSGQRYRELAGTAEPLFGDYRWMLPHGECFDLKPGDVLFLPRGVFHVGVQSEYSVSVAIPQYTYPDTRLLARSILPEIVESVAVEGDSIPSPMRELGHGWQPIARELADTARTMLKSVLGDIDDLIDAAAGARWQRLLSNGGWEVIEHDLAQADAAAEAERVLADAMAASVRLTRPYRMYCTSADDTGVRVTARGTTLHVPRNAALTSHLEALAAGVSVTIDDELRADPNLAALLLTGGFHVSPTRDPVKP